MDARKFAALMKGLQSAYPNARLVDTDEGMQMWFRMLKDIPYDQLSIAIQQHISTSKFPPSIAEIREFALRGEEKDWSEAWGEVLRCISLFGLYREKEALAYLKSKDEICYLIVKRLSFKEICLSENIQVERANFRMAYEAQGRIDRERKSLPDRLKVMLDNTIKAIE